MGEPIYAADNGKSITSLCEIHTVPTTVWHCRACTHMRGRVLDDNKTYYESDYRISLNDDEEDQIYEKSGGRIIYRTQHQARVLLDKLDLGGKPRILDYGCAKSTTMKQVLQSWPDVDLHLFDVSDMYVPYWDRLVAKDHQATFDVPEAWRGTFDVLTSFFALEHIPERRETLTEVSRLLGPAGVFYGIVPDAISNPADFVVVDHVNHFTPPSLHRALQQAGFLDIDIDTNIHRGAMVFVARKTGTPTPPPNPETINEKVRKLATYWNGIGSVIANAESAAQGNSAAIYGSGFYGAYIFSRLQNPDAVECFLDQSPFLQGRSLFGRKIIMPEKLPSSVDTIYVGLNPSIAREVIASMPWLDKSGRKIFFLDEVAS